MREADLPRSGEETERMMGSIVELVLWALCEIVECCCWWNFYPGDKKRDAR